METLTAIVEAYTVTMTLAEKIWDATPQAQQIAAASDWATFAHTMGQAFSAIQKAVQALPPKTP